jgi:putative DNA primase/helicase
MKTDVTAEMLQRLNEELASANSAKSLSQNAQAKSTAVAVQVGSFKPSSLVPEIPAQITKLKSALSVLSPDALRGQGKLYEPGETVPSEDYWLIVVWAIASLGWSCGEEMAREWSMQSDRYTEEGFDDAWNAYDPTVANPIGIGSLYKLAKEHGWQEAITLDALPVPVPEPERYKILSPAQISQIPPIQWRVKHILPSAGLAAIFGASGSGKSFLALDLGYAISHGRPWFGIRTYQTTVIHMMLEGESGIKNRVHALELAHGPLPSGGFGAVCQSFQLTRPQDIVDLSAVIPTGSVVFIDTLNRAAPTADENSSRDMGIILEGAKLLYQATNSLVVFVHHTGKDISRGMRGHSSLFAALDGAIEVHRNDQKRSWTVAKTKDGEDGKTVNFRLKHHVLGQDVDGEDITSCTIEADAAQVLVMREPSGAKQKLALAAIRRALMSATNTGKCTSGPGTPCLSVTEAIAAVATELTTDPANKRNNKAKSLIDGLLVGGYLCSGIGAQGEGWVWKL